jgi:hypothetical protein
MGEWIVPDHRVLLADVLGSPAFAVPADKQGPLVLALRESGFLVESAYYVPTPDELFDMYRQLAEADYHGGGRANRSWLRWVMCGETQLELYRRHGQTRAIHTPNLSLFLDGGELTPEVVDELHQVMTVRAAASIPAALDAGRLFDMPIRRDPAARRPMWEVIPKSERPA